MDLASNQPRDLRLPMAILAVGAFTTSLNVTLLSPLLKLVAADFGVADATAGQLAAVTAACAALTGLAVAPWLDRYPRRAWLGVEGALLALGTLLSATAPSFGWLVAGRALAGVGGAVIFAVCLAAVGDLFPGAKERNRAVGLVGTAATLGAVLGLPVLTQIAAAAGWRVAVAALLPLAALVAVGSARLPHAAAAAASPRRRWAAGYRRVLGRGETVWLLGLMAVQSLVWFGWLIYFAAYAETAFGAGPGILSLLFLVAGGAEIAGSNIVPVLLRWLPARTVAGAAAALLAANLLAVGLVYGDRSALFPFVAVVSLASVVLFTATSILLLDSSPSARGAVMALQSVGFEVGGAAGAAAAGWALVALGDYAAVYRLLGAVVPLAAVCLLASARPARADRAPSGQPVAPAVEVAPSVG